MAKYMQSEAEAGVTQGLIGIVYVGARRMRTESSN